MGNLINVEAFELDKGVYYIELQQGTYEIDGKRVQIGWNDNKVIVDLESSPKIYRVDIRKKIEHYLNSSNDILSIEDYNQRYTKLNKSEDFEFDNIDDEYAFKKFVQEWKAIYTSFEVKTLVEYSIKYNVYNLPKYITPMRKLNGDLKNTIYVYDQAKHILELTEKALLEIGYIKSSRESTIEGEFYLSKDSIRFSKINNRDFLTIQISNLRQYEEKGIYKDTYVKVFELYNSNIINIDKIIKIWYASQTKLDGILYSEVLKELKDLTSLVKGIEVKTKDTCKGKSLNKISSLITSLEKSLIKS